MTRLKLIELVRRERYLEFQSLAQWQRWRKAHVELLAERWRLGQHLAGAYAYGSFPGWCVCCARQVEFSIPQQMPAAGQAWEYRDYAHCSGCGNPARVRLGFELLLGLTGGDPQARVYLGEQFGPACCWLLQHFPHAVCSEFVPDPAQRVLVERRLRSQGGPAAAQGLRHEDVTALRMDARSLDALVSFDVLEHVPDYRAALAEFARVLKPGGHAILTAPLLLDAQHTITRACYRPDGTIVHLCGEPEYHGDPLAPGGGVLCWHHFGWDVLETMRRVGFQDARAVLAWSMYKGMPTLLPIWVAQR